jgi:glycosyltransferase involved in cell wall biosynthesis
VNEALAHNVPVIGSVYSQAVEELIVDGQNGWLFHPDKEEEFEQTLKTVLGISPEKLLEMKKSCKSALEKVSVDVAVQNMLKAIEKCS